MNRPYAAPIAPGRLLRAWLLPKLAATTPARVLACWLWWRQLGAPRHTAAHPQEDR